jgi:hypothetical protein
MKAKSIQGSSPEEIQSALNESIADGYNPTLAILFVSIKQDRKAICEILNEKGIDIFGATSCGEFTNDYQGEGTAVILLLDLNRESYSIIYEDIVHQNTFEVAADIGKSALQLYTKPAFILCCTSMFVQGEFSINGEEVVRGIESTVGQHVNMYGGMAGDDWNLKGTYVFTYQKETEHGIIALILDEDKVDIEGMAISGWKPIGITRTVTGSEGKWLYTIDNQPALDMYLKYLGSESKPGEDKYKMFEEIGIFYPFQVEREFGEPIMISPMEIDREKNALFCENNIPQGTKLRFSLPPDFDIVEKVLDKAGELKEKKQNGAEALLIFSCAGRKSSMGPLTDDENQGLSKLWNSPMAGFYTYGEFGRAINGRQEFHSTTCSWVVLKEKNNLTEETI